MKYILIIIAIVLLLIGGFMFFNKSVTGGSINVQDNNQDVQKITLSMKNYNYSPNTIKVKANQPVEITLDASVRGCYRSFNIRALGVSYQSSSPADIIKFTPSQKGSFRFQCSMGMGTGTIIVE